MSVTYSEIKEEVKQVSLLISSSNEVVPSVFSCFKNMILPIGLYFIFYFLCPLGELFDKNLWLGLGVMSVFFWFFISYFLYGYSVLFSMLPESAFEDYKILKIYKSKAKKYYAVWIFMILVSGFLSLFTMFNVIALAAISLLSTIVLAISFSLDVSRYQISAIFGAASAIKQKIND
ncbi:hypothetical protein [Mixta sp. Marseille-Q2659]|uniref:hypothetical protein n=1 Tax=Mixta sp. Marseille-Q2659 TaxID=2736607 RepID=UPI0023BA1F12|nr:hypothetical protein [Mixta sp. Marseille-Q2659]